jgi:Amylo-alpha-1,6-glucosidase
MRTRLPYRKEAYRLWFEYLRLARESSDAKVRKALQRSARHYDPWGNLQNVNFDRWWREHQHLFEEQFSVRRLSRGEKPLDNTALIIEVPLTQPKSKLFAQVREIIKDAYPSQTPRKAHLRPVTQYRLTVGAEPRTAALREMLHVYRVHLENPGLRGLDRLKKVHAYYLGRKRKAKIPAHLDFDRFGDSIVAQRNVLRYIAKAKRIMLNVAKGEFPGEYE